MCPSTLPEDCATQGARVCHTAHARVPALEPQNHRTMGWFGLEGILKLISTPCHGRYTLHWTLRVGCHTRLLQVSSSWP